LNAARKPDFLIVGTSRGGTTSLYRLLRDEPSVFMPAKTELHHFSYGRVYRKETPDRYLHHFTDAAPGQKIGEKSPSYFWFPETAQAIRAALPDVRIVCTIRDPVDRALSDFAHGDAPIPDEAALVALIEQGLDHLDRGQLMMAPFHPSAILWKGLYRRHLGEYLMRFPKHQLLLIDFAEIVQNPGGVIRALSDHLEAPLTGTKIPVSNASDGSTKAFPKARDMLVKFYEQENQFLANLRSVSFDLNQLTMTPAGKVGADN